MSTLPSKVHVPRVRPSLDGCRIATGQPRRSVGGGSASFGRRSCVGIGLGTSFDLGPGPAFSRSIEVVFGKGAVPKDRDAYDARDVVKNVGYGRQRT